MYKDKWLCLQRSHLTLSEVKQLIPGVQWKSKNTYSGQTSGNSNQTFFNKAYFDCYLKEFICFQSITLCTVNVLIWSQLDFFSFIL